MDKENEDVTFWKKNYYEMKKMKAEAEDDLAAQRLLKEQNERTLMDSIEILKEKKSDAKPATLPEKHSYEHLLEVIKFYEQMTSMTVKVKNVNSFCCTIKNPASRSASRFSITRDDKEFKYEPVANIEKLPEYMQFELSFDASMGPVLLNDALSSIFEDAGADESTTE